MKKLAMEGMLALGIDSFAELLQIARGDVSGDFLFGRGCNKFHFARTG